MKYGYVLEKVMAMFSDKAYQNMIIIDKKIGFEIL